MIKKGFFSALVSVTVLVTVGLLGYWMVLRKNPPVNSFEECIARGFPVAQSYPRQCKAGNKTFVEEVQESKDSQEKLRVNDTGLPLILPPGFSISFFAKDVPGARVMKFDQAGRLLVSLTSQGKVVALPDEDGDYKADKAITVLQGLNRPHGLEIYCGGATARLQCKLYVAEEDQIVMFDYDETLVKVSNKRKLLDLPGGAGHFTRTLGFGPEGRLYVSVGSSCNVCEEADFRRAKIFSLNKDGSDFREHASGLRNAVFFAWSPGDGRMWATDMGRDHLGDDLPPDEINIIEKDRDYGWPVCFGKNILDTNFHKDDHLHVRPDCTEPFEIPSYIDIPAHSAPLGLAFVPKEGWPEEYWDDLIVAYHGSWNRSLPTGYKVVWMKLDEKGNYLGTKDFVTGWLKDREVLGRPVDILIEPRGTMYISDDKAGVVYRVSS